MNTWNSAHNIYLISNAHALNLFKCLSVVFRCNQITVLIFLRFISKLYAREHALFKCFSFYLWYVICVTCYTHMNTGYTTTIAEQKKKKKTEHRGWPIGFAATHCNSHCFTILHSLIHRRCEQFYCRVFNYATQSGTWLKSGATAKSIRKFLSVSQT